MVVNTTEIFFSFQYSLILGLAEPLPIARNMYLSQVWCRQQNTLIHKVYECLLQLATRGYPLSVEI
jgi:hypothetical protein